MYPLRSPSGTTTEKRVGVRCMPKYFNVRRSLLLGDLSEQFTISPHLCRRFLSGSYSFFLAIIRASTLSNLCSLNSLLARHAEKSFQCIAAKRGHSTLAHSGFPFVSRSEMFSRGDRHRYWSTCCVLVTRYYLRTFTSIMLPRKCNARE